MLTREETRRLKLGELAKEVGNATKLANRAGVAPSEVHRVIRGERNLGDKLARRLEKAGKKPQHWLDHQDISPQAYDVACSWDGLADEDKVVILRIIGSSKPAEELAHPLLSDPLGASLKEAQLHRERLKLEEQADLEPRRDKAHHPPRAKDHGTPDTGVPAARASSSGAESKVERKKARRVRN